MTLLSCNAVALLAPQSKRFPQRQIKHFKGEILEWTSFWESFNTYIHLSTRSDVQKLNYLKEYFKGEAYLYVENLELTAENYNITIAELKRVYAKPKALIQTHLCKFDSLAPVKSMTDVAALRRLQLTIQSHINALETLGVQKDNFGGLLGTKFMKLLPAELQEDWSNSDANDIIDITALLNFIGDQVDAAERYRRWKSITVKRPQQTTPTTPAKQPPAATASKQAIGARYQQAPQTRRNSKQITQPSNVPPRRQDNFIFRECTRPCIFCGEIHYPTVCPVNFKDKKAIIARQKRCVRCFSANHETANCPTNYVCKHCQATHHTALCDKKVTRFAHQTANRNTAPTNVMASVSSVNTNGDLVVKTATVMVVGPDGKETRAILFIDDGSHRSWVTRSISKLLNLKVVAVDNIGTRIFKQRKPNPVEQINAVELVFRGIWKGAPLVKITALETDYIGDTGTYSRHSQGNCGWKMRKLLTTGLKPTARKKKNMEKMEAGKEAKESSPSQPRSKEEISSQELNHTSRNKKKKRKIMKKELKWQTDFDLSLFWKLEHFAILEDCDVVEPENLLSSFGDKITRQEDGRYCTPIPWKTDKWSFYHKEIDQLRVQNFVDEADLNYEGLRTYLPHHPVIPQDKTSTKIRPVFNGAAKSKYGPSLNDILENGPNLHPDLLAVLMRFHLHRIAWIANIEKRPF
ncbi:Uncharacterized protein APZ42_028968 [Daphnia magna]|uniref:Peptidase aspartic putative domain-containing protein n=1 Tax=Daphnia magna TaxID=35525 RepID=A0A164Q0U5_9CRUS|nr:Uncharacterized protein APZ42_028968 [Daphnia magna]